MQFIDQVLAPDKCPNPDHTDREIWMKVGERQLAQKLLALYITQQEE